jgi:sterol desaturase/sphingolipid hydroxylase (fatty acid hydroxylase superfamily)
MFVLILFVVAEYLISKQKRLNNFDSYEIYSNLLFIAIDRVLSFFTGSDGGAFALWVWNHRLFQWPLEGVAKWISLFIVSEFVYYWVHWYNHHVNIGWATHIMHHSPMKYNLTTGYRLGITRLFSLGWLVGLPMMLLGIHPQDLALMLGIIFFYNFFIHTELIGSLGWLDLIFNTPSNHRVHHADEPALYNKNLGGVTVVFDHLFGTYAAEEGRITKYGIPKMMEPKKLSWEIFGYWSQVFRSFISARGVSEKLKALFGAPIEIEGMAQGEVKNHGVL